MTKKERNVILIIVAVIIAVLIIAIVAKGNGDKGTKPNTNTTTGGQNEEKYATNLVDGTKINNSDNFNKNKKYKNIEISNIQFTYKDGKSVLLADLKNTGSTTQENEIVKITILDENNKEIDVLSPVLPKIEPGQTKPLNVTISGADAVNAKDFKIEAK